MIDQYSDFNGESYRKKPLGGTETAFVLLAESLSKLGHKVIALTKSSESIEYERVFWKRLQTKIEECDIYIVNRGWISKEEFNNQEALLNSRITIEGIYSPFRRFGLNLSNEDQIEGWPKTVQELTYEKAVLDIGMEVEDTVIQLSAGSIGAFEPIWLPAEFKPSRHYGYAVQWFGLALVLTVSYIYFGLKREK